MSLVIKLKTTNFNKEIAKNVKENIKRNNIKFNKELASRMLRYTVLKTPVVSGSLRMGWQAKTNYTNDSIISKVYNNVNYAEYVEYGHRQNVGQFVPAIGKRLKQPFVKGRYMMTRSLIELNSQVDGIVQDFSNKIRW